MDKSAAQPALTDELKEYILEQKQVPGSLIAVLHKVQDHFGYIPRAIAFDVANLMEIPVAKIYGVVTFYHSFKLEPPGDHKIGICTGTACYLKGGQELLEELGDILGVEENTVTDDGLFSYQSVRCLGCCGQAPAISVDGEVYGSVTAEKLSQIIDKYRGEDNG
ncbi:MAG: NAD(P)H-dependent oxidoreductase subunit E [Chlamydiota bacterium]